MNRKFNPVKVISVVAIVFMLWVVGSVIVASMKSEPSSAVVSDERTICQKLNDKMVEAFVGDVKEGIESEKAGKPEPEDDIRRTRDIVTRMRQNNCPIG